MNLVPFSRPNSALLQYLEVRSRRALSRQGAAWRQMLLAFGLPALGLKFGLGTSLEVFLGTIVALTLVAVPLYLLLIQCYGTLRSLRRGRALEEILGSGVTAAQLADTLMLHALGMLLKVGLPFLLLVIVVTTASGHECSQLLMAPEAAWLPLAAVLLVLGAYAGLLWEVTSVGNARNQAPRLYLLVPVLLSQTPGLATIVFGLIWLVGLRQLAIV